MISKFFSIPWLKNAKCSIRIQEWFYLAFMNQLFLAHLKLNLTQNKMHCYHIYHPKFWMTSDIKLCTKQHNNIVKKWNSRIWGIIRLSWQKNNKLDITFYSVCECSKGLHNKGKKLELSLLAFRQSSKLIVQVFGHWPEFKVIARGVGLSAKYRKLELSILPPFNVKKVDFSFLAHSTRIWA